METIDDIVREMRNEADLLSIVGAEDHLNEFADRIQAAVKALEADRDNWRRQALDEDARANAATCKESLPVGNAAQMREALRAVEDLLKALSKSHATNLPKEVESILGEMAFHVAGALSAPPRNCDVLSKDEVLKVLDNRSFSKEDTIEWLYEEAKGETDEQK